MTIASSKSLRVGIIAMVHLLCLGVAAWTGPGAKTDGPGIAAAATLRAGGSILSGRFAPQVGEEGGGSSGTGEGPPLTILDGDSAITELELAGSRASDKVVAGQAFMRAGFLAYVKGDFARAEEFFAEARDKGVGEADLWRGLAFLADKRIDDAEGRLRAAVRSAADSVTIVAATVGLAACDLAAGRAGDGVERCLRLIEAGGRVAASASVVLQQCLFELEETEDGISALEDLAKRYPLAYEVAVIKNTKRPTPAEETSAETGPPGDGGTEIDEAVEAQAGEAFSEDATPGSTPAESQEAQSERTDESAPEDLDSGGAGVSEGEATYAVQVGAFSSETNASILLERLVNRGYDAVRVESETREDRVFHCVRVGFFASRADAASMASTLEEEEGLSTAIVRTAAGSSSGSQGANE